MLDESKKEYFFYIGFYYLLIENSLDKAKPEFEKSKMLYLQNIENNTYEDHVLLSMIYLFLGDYQKAKLQISQRFNVENNKDLDTAYFILGIIELKLNNYKESEDALKKALEIFPEYVSALKQLADVHKATEKIQEAIECYNRALEINPGHAEIWNYLGLAYYRTNNPEKALECYNKAIALKPDFAVVFNNMALIFDEKRLTDKAEFNYKKSLELEENNDITIQNYSSFLKKNNRIKEAIRLLERYLEKNRESKN
ncbi:MAG: tetratricopeptide repeat protein [Leptospiraceae bacterium]|nr:tetratricopeptide repeat protein [Leptospiraceae bacterium]